MAVRTPFRQRTVEKTPSIVRVNARRKDRFNCVTSVVSATLVDHIVPIVAYTHNIIMTRVANTLVLVIVALVTLGGSNAFVPRTQLSTTVTRRAQQVGLNAKKKDDLSYLETRDMTKEEMLELNKKNEEIMNMELSMMTGFSLVISLPILYLCWVAFFSD